ALERMDGAPRAYPVARRGAAHGGAGRRVGAPGVPAARQGARKRARRPGAAPPARRGARPGGALERGGRGARATAAGDGGAAHGRGAVGRAGPQHTHARAPAHRARRRAGGRRPGGCGGGGLQERLEAVERAAEEERTVWVRDRQYAETKRTELLKLYEEVKEQRDQI